jgi:hypothetical protein
MLMSLSSSLVLYLPWGSPTPYFHFACELNCCRWIIFLCTNLRPLHHRSCLLVHAQSHDVITTTTTYRIVFGGSCNNAGAVGLINVGARTVTKRVVTAADHNVQACTFASGGSIAFGGSNSSMVDLWSHSLGEFITRVPTNSASVFSLTPCTITMTPCQTAKSDNSTDRDDMGGVAGVIEKRELLAASGASPYVDFLSELRSHAFACDTQPALQCE